MARRKPNPGPTVTECCVLGLLIHKEQSGYDMNKFAQQSVGMIYAPAKSRIYAVLPRLLEAGLVTRREVAQERRPDKWLYRITPRGREALREWLNDTSQPLTRPLLLLKVFFGSEAEPEALAEQLRRRREEIASELETLSEIDRDYRDPTDEAMFFPHLTLDWGLAIDPVEIDWIDRALERIEARRRGGARRGPRPRRSSGSRRATRSQAADT
jgi:PadR family transcriptional regulator, regulatory protein AphA